MPTALGLLPSNQPIPNGRVQSKIAAHTGAEMWVNAGTSGQKLSDGATGAMEIAVTPTYDCFWVVRSNLIVRGLDPSWQRWDYTLRLDKPDRNGFTYRDIVTKGHSAVGWTAFAGRAVWRLAGGTAYTCAIYAGYQSGGTTAWYCSNEYTRLIGRTVAEGAMS
jgi:hypothetical protein